MTKPLRCQLRLHRWTVVSSDDGSYRFRRCLGCGKEKVPGDRAHPSAAPWG